MRSGTKGGPADGAGASARGAPETRRRRQGCIPPHPPGGRGSPYLRPLLIGTGPTSASPRPRTRPAYCSRGGVPQGGRSRPSTSSPRRPGQHGSTKCVGNYSPCSRCSCGKKAGYSDVIYLDAVNNKYIEEVSSCNFSSSRATPRRARRFDLARDHAQIRHRDGALEGFEVEERDERGRGPEADECFAPAPPSSSSRWGRDVSRGAQRVPGSGSDPAGRASTTSSPGWRENRGQTGVARGRPEGHRPIAECAGDRVIDVLFDLAQRVIVFRDEQCARSTFSPVSASEALEKKSHAAF